MVKYILIVSFLLVSAANIFGWLDVGFDSFSEANKIIDKKELKDKIKVPEGMEKEYQAILHTKSENENNVNQPISQGQKKQTISDKEAKEQANAFLNQEQYSKPQQNIKVSNKDKKFLLKVSGMFIKNNRLILNIKIFNNQNSDYNDTTIITCTAKNNSGQSIDVFSWTGNLNIPSKKTILLQEADFGHANIIEQVSFNCEI